MRRFKNIIASLIVFILPVLLLTPVAALPSMSVVASQSSSQACQGISQLGDSSQNCGKGQTDITKLIKSVVTLLSTLIGVAAVIMIIFAGFRYITSGGDSNRVSSAKSTIIYAVIGLVIAVLAQVIVNFAVSVGTSGS
jgi:beta-lactamase regulating signal transducer with metallopeptidase domain